jgi:hypothetical protein
VSAVSIEEFMRTLERVQSGASGAVATLARLARDVWLITPVEQAPTPGENIQVPALKDDDGRTLFPVFSTEATFKRWGFRSLWGTLPALAVFEAVLAIPCDALVVDPAGPNRIRLERDVVMTLVNIARSDASH